MQKFLQVAILSLFIGNASALPLEHCSNLLSPGALPVISKKVATEQLCHTGYFLNYDPIAKIPVSSSWKIVPSQAYGCVARSNSFKLDPDSAFSPAKNDYKGTVNLGGTVGETTFDRGHLANNADLRYSEQTESESFFMTNMTPQIPSLNRGIWKKLEDQTRQWAVQRGHALVIHAGPIYSADNLRMKSDIVVPSAFWKIIVDAQTGESMSFIFQQDTPPSDKLQQHLVRIENVQAITNVSIMHVGNVKQSDSVWQIIKTPFTRSCK